MKLKITTSIREVIDRAIAFSELPQDVRHECEAIDDADSVSWRLLQTVCKFVREREPGDRGGPWLWQVAQGSRLLLTAPAEKQRSPELLARLERLRKEDEERRYNAMVHDITHNEREAEEKRNAVLPTTRLQLSFGAHMLVMMLTFYLLFFYGARSFFDSPALIMVSPLGSLMLCTSFLAPSPGLQPVHHALGAIGIFAALLMETVLYISRTSINAEGGRKYLDLLGQPRQPVPPPLHPFTAFTTTPAAPKLKAA